MHEFRQGKKYIDDLAGLIVGLRSQQGPDKTAAAGSASASSAVAEARGVIDAAAVFEKDFIGIAALIALGICGPYYKIVGFGFIQLVDGRLGIRALPNKIVVVVGSAYFTYIKLVIDIRLRVGIPLEGYLAVSPQASGKVDDE